LFGLLPLDSLGLAAAAVQEQVAAGVCGIAPRLSCYCAVCWVGRSFAAGFRVFSWCFHCMPIVLPLGFDACSREPVPFDSVDPGSLFP